jgi:hypothetical protein
MSTLQFILLTTQPITMHVTTRFTRRPHLRPRATLTSAPKPNATTHGTHDTVHPHAHANARPHPRPHIKHNRPRPCPATYMHTSTPTYCPSLASPYVDGRIRSPHTHARPQDVINVPVAQILFLAGGCAETQMPGAFPDNMQIRQRKLLGYVVRAGKAFMPQAFESSS